MGPEEGNIKRHIQFSCFSFFRSLLFFLNLFCLARKGFGKPNENGLSHHVTTNLPSPWFAHPLMSVKHFLAPEIGVKLPMFSNKKPTASCLQQPKIQQSQSSLKVQRWPKVWPRVQQNHIFPKKKKMKCEVQVDYHGGSLGV